MHLKTARVSLRRLAMAKERLARAAERREKAKRRLALYAKRLKKAKQRLALSAKRLKKAKRQMRKMPNSIRSCVAFILRRIAVKAGLRRADG